MLRSQSAMTKIAYNTETLKSAAVLPSQNVPNADTKLQK